MLTQLALAFFGLSAMFMATGNNPRARRWAPIIGLCGQPAWMYFAYQTQAGGLAVLSLVYTMVYIRGALVQWRFS